MRLSSRCTIAIMLSVPLALPAQEAGPRTDALLARAEQGDAAARSEAEKLGWLWIKHVAEHGKLDAESARAMARTLLLLQGFPAPDHAPTLAERPWRGGAVTALAMALAEDHADTWSAAQLERLAPYPFIWKSPKDELQILRTMDSVRGNLPSPLMVTRIRLELEAGSIDSADAALQRLAMDALSPAARGHLISEIRFSQRHDSAGAVAYYDGVHAIRDSADAAWYTRELLWIARLEELDQWNALPPEARGPWLEKFWNRRDIADGQLPGIRLPEQFRRWRYAVREARWQYDNSSVRGVFIPNEEAPSYNSSDIPFPKDPHVAQMVYLNRLRPLTQILDDRGGLILRHGEPEFRVAMPGITQLDEETWKWNTVTGPLIVSFSRQGANGQAGSLRFGMMARNYPVGDLMANCFADSRLCNLAAMAMMNPAGPATLAFAANIQQDYQRMRVEAEHTDNNRERFAKELGAVAQAYGIPDLGTLVVFAVPAKSLVPDEKDRARTMDFAARLRIVTGDLRTGEYAGILDTLRSWKLRKPPNDSTQLTGFVLVPTSIGDWSVSIVLSDLGRTAGTGERIDDVPVPAFDGRALRLSDLILGSNASGLAWKHGSETIPLNPRNAWRPGEDAVLTYEVDGMVRGRRYETQVEIWDANPATKAYRNAVVFTTAANELRTLIQRDLSLRELPDGDYRVVLRIRDTVTGATVARERKLAVRK